MILIDGLIVMAAVVLQHTAESVMVGGVICIQADRCPEFPLCLIWTVRLSAGPGKAAVGARIVWVKADGLAELLHCLFSVAGLVQSSGEREPDVSIFGIESGGRTELIYRLNMLSAVA